MTINTISELPKNAKDLTGQKFGRLTAIKPTKERKDYKIVWECICSCGKKCFVQSTSLRSKNTKSCGCLYQESISLGANKIHGMTGTSIHRTWKGMTQRCQNPSNPNYKNYGGRGIRVCDEWKNNFIAFMNYIEKNLDPKPNSQHTVDRINNDGNYEPGNIRWATYKEQANNRRPKSCGPHKQYWFRAWHKDMMCQFASNNQHEFAKQHGLDFSRISRCLLKKQRTHKGWILKRI